MGEGGETPVLGGGVGVFFFFFFWKRGVFGKIAFRSLSLSLSPAFSSDS